MVFEMIAQRSDGTLEHWNTQIVPETTTAAGWVLQVGEKVLH